jgi:Leucine-rich repeat (LRR) protein
MKSRINDEKKLSLILRFVILLQSLVLSQSYWRSLHSQPSLSWLGNRVINSDVVSKSWPQFVFETFQTQSLSLSSLALNPKAEALPLSGAPPQRKASNITNGCSPLVRDPICSCYALDEGLLIDCKISAIYQMTDVLNSLISQPIKSFSVHTINLTLNSFPERLFQNFSTIEQIYICLPSLVEISAEALVGLDASLKTLSIVNSKLTAVPKAALKGLNTLSALDLQSNAIREVEANAFSGLPLVSLNLQSNLINSLDDFSFGGLQNSLVELVLIDNKFQSFPVHALQHLTKLEVLKLQTNTISEIRVDGITRLNALKSLDLQSNHFQNLDENSFIITPNLVSLSVANNRLKVLNDSSVFEHLLDLEALDLSYNKLKVIYLNKLIALRTVDLSNNELNDIRLHNVPNLREVFVSNNNILRLTNDTFVNSSSLSVIFLQHNAIQSIDYNTFHSLQHLLTLDLSSNQLKAIDPQLLKYNSGLQSLYLDNNSISVLEPKALDGLEELQQIDLSHNVIRTISPSLLQNLTSLETLHLDSNWLSTIPNGLLHTSLQNFKTLSLDNNPIVRIREDQSSGYGLSALEVLAINDANLSIIASHDLLGFPNLKILSLKNNGIQKLSPSALRPVPTLNELDLSVNRLDVIPEECLSGLVELKLLNISANNLSELPHFSSDLKSVQSLDISYNRVTRVHSFGHLAQSVVYVSVRHNMIGWIANNAFHNLTSLKTIDIRQNFLTQLNEMIFSPIESNLQSLFLSGIHYFINS